MIKSKEFGYNLVYDNESSIRIDNQHDNAVIEKKYFQSLTEDIINKRIVKFIPYNNDLIITYLKGYIRLKDYQNFFNLEEFDVIKNRYLRQMRWENDIKVIKEKSKYIVLTSSLVMGLLCGAKLGRIETSKNDTFRIDNQGNSKITPVYSDNMYQFKDEQVNKLMSNKVNTMTKDTYLVNLDYGDNTSSEKLQEAQKNYSDKINKYAQKYGLDANLVLAICTQERGTHSDTIDSGGACGLMQIQVNAHPNGSSIYTTTFDSFNKPSDQVFTFNIDNYQTLDGNLDAGCALLRSYLNEFNGNMVAAIYAYNAGNGTVLNAINRYAKDNNMDYDMVLKELNNYEWHKFFTNESNDYLEAVMQYFIDSEIKYYNVLKDSDGKVTAEYVTCNLCDEDGISIKK